MSSRLVVGLLISFVYSRWVLPRNEGAHPKINPTLPPILYEGMVIVPYDAVSAVHLHHWVWYLLVCVISVFTHVPDICVGFSLGMVLQGISYADSCAFACGNPYGAGHGGLGRLRAARN